MMNKSSSSSFFKKFFFKFLVSVHLINSPETWKSPKLQVLESSPSFRLMLCSCHSGHKVELFCMSLHHFKHTFPQNNRNVWHNWHLGENASVSTRITSSAVSLPERWTHTHWRFFRHRVRTCNSGRMFIYSISITHFLFAFSSAALTAHKVYF